MKTLLACSVIIVALISNASYAKPPSGIGGGQQTHGNSGNGGGGQGHGNSGGNSVTGGAIPPGLQNKGTPPGLKMLNKTPSGWSKGQKKGWQKSP